MLLRRIAARSQLHRSGPEQRHEADLRLLDDPALWDKTIIDERYLLLDRR
jgi:hypothetical protein